ncbi:MAG TPA: sigma-70 family RNA polymerase sigma factor [Chryseolinea sp.]|nr:sigma-70 family RNA polymerase sigma factor [Chryseolinea sp.]
MNPANNMSDEKLIQFYLNGNPNAMATLVELYKDRIYGSIYATVQDKHLAEEIFHDVFVQIINNMMAGLTPEDGGFLQWAIKLAHALCIERSRKTQATIVANSTTVEVKDQSLTVLSIGPLYHESHGKIKSMIDMLPHDQREVIMLNHYAGLSLKDITDVMKCSLTVALDNLKFGLNNLRKMMIEKEIALQ